MKTINDFDEVVKYCKRENRKADLKDAYDSSSDYAQEATDALTKSNGVDMTVHGGRATVTIPLNELRSEIQRAYLNGAQKGRDLGGLERLFSDVHLDR
ncbi:TPA: hypothetical protein N2G38_004469 [Salmonella enterica]|nr:hypothetical protein [Salmonella enterica]